MLTNPPFRRVLTGWFGRLSRVENRLLATVAIELWRHFGTLDLSDSEATDFRSIQACFTRRLRPGARPVDPDGSTLASPCDAILGAAGPVAGGTILQVKGFAYELAELLGEPGAAAAFHGGAYATLRLTAGMYHRFHAPDDIRVSAVDHRPGDCWNVNPPTLRRIPRLYCRNERAVIHASLAATGEALAVVPVAAVLVSGIRLGFLDLSRGRTPSARACDVTLRRGEEMGWFEHGSTIVLLAPPGYRLVSGLATGDRIRAGASLMRRGSAPAP